MDAEGKARTIEVLPPSRTGEVGVVVRTAFHIAFWSMLPLGIQRGCEARKATTVVAPRTRTERFGPTVAFADLTARDQRIVLRIREGLVEMEAARSASGRWPEVTSLAAQGLPPFAPDPIDRAADPWAMLQQNEIINYFDAPPAGQRGFLISLAEPSKGAAPDNSPPDDTHHRLGDGTMIHVLVWVGPGKKPGGPAVGIPPLLDGWKQVVFEGPSAN